MASYTPISKHHSKRQLPIAPSGHLPNYGQMSRDSPPSSSYQNSPSDSQRGSYASSVPMMQKAPPHLQHRQAGLPQNSSTHMYNSGNPSQIDHGKQQPPPLPPYRPPPTQHYRGPPVPMQNTGFYAGIGIAAIVFLLILFLNLIFCTCSPWRKYWLNRKTGNR